MSNNKPKGLKLRGEVWWIDKIIHTRAGERIAVRESTKCRTIEDASLVLERRCREVEYQDEHLIPTQERTFTEAAAEYLLDVERRGKSIERLKTDLKNLIPEFGHLPLSHLHQRTIQPWVDDQKGRYASGTVRRMLSTLTSILNYTAQVLRDGHEPWLKTAPPKLRAPDWGSRRPRPISWKEQDRLLEEVAHHLLGPVKFLIYTGARHNEVVSLRWDQHREVEGAPTWAFWWIPPEVRKASSSQRVSERDGRFLVANTDARSVIESQTLVDSPDGWVFPSPHGGRLYGANGIGWRGAVARAGLNIRLHDLRHTFGVRAADAGIPLDVRRSLLGHRHSDITLHYSKPGLLRLLEEAERITRQATVQCAKGAGGTST